MNDEYSFWGESKIDAPGLNNAYQMFYGENGNKSKSLKCQAWQSNNPSDMFESECIIKAPDFTTIDSAILPSWKECKQWFIDYCQNNVDYIDKTLKMSSLKKADSGYTYWNTYLAPDGDTCIFYGVNNSPLKSLLVIIAENDGMYKYTIADNTSINVIHESDYVFSSEENAFYDADAWLMKNAEEYLQQYENQYAYSSYIMADEDSISDDLDDIDNNDLIYDNDSEVPDAIAKHRDFRKGCHEFTFWNVDIQLEMASEYYGIYGDEKHSLFINVAQGFNGFEAIVQYPVNGFYGTADKFVSDTINGVLHLAEDFCVSHAMEYLDTFDVFSSKKKSGRTFKSAKRKWTARERLALINEERLDEDSNFDDLI